MAQQELLSHRLSDCTFVFFDIETTGLDPSQAHIIEVATCTVKNGEEVGNYSSFVCPMVPGTLFSTVSVPPEITRITGIRNSDLAGQPTFETIYADLLNSLDDGILVAHNAEFDLSFLAAKMKPLGKLPPNPVLDTLRISRSVAPELSRHGMDSLKSVYGIKAERAHRALDDTRALAELFPKLVKRAYPDGNPTLRELLKHHGPMLPFDVPPPKPGGKGR